MYAKFEMDKGYVKKALKAGVPGIDDAGWARVSLSISHDHMGDEWCVAARDLEGNIIGRMRMCGGDDIILEGFKIQLSFGDLS